MVCIQSIICNSGINSDDSQYTHGNNTNIIIGTKERNEDWGNIGGDDMTYGSIW